MKKKTFTSLEKAVDILDLFDMNKREFSAQEISSTLDLPLSSVYKYIDFLVNRQLLRHKPNSKMYGLGYMITRLSYVLQKDFDLVEIIRPYLESLSEETGETAMLTIIVGEEAVCLDRVEPQRLVKLSLDPGRRLPLYTGSSSKILLAFQTDEFIDNFLREHPLLQVSDKTITDPEILKDNLQQIRKDGFSISDSEVDAGAKAVSVPVLDQKGTAIAGLTVAGPSERFEQQQLSVLCKRLQKESEKISVYLGFSSKKSLVPESA